jgi:hypothetical protein
MPAFSGFLRYFVAMAHAGSILGDPHKPNWYTRLHYDQMYVPQILDRIKNTAPPGADLTSWRY